MWRAFAQPNGMTTWSHTRSGRASYKNVSRLNLDADHLSPTGRGVLSFSKFSGSIRYTVRSPSCRRQSSCRADPSSSANSIFLSTGFESPHSTVESVWRNWGQCPTLVPVTPVGSCWRAMSTLAGPTEVILGSPEVLMFLRYLCRSRRVAAELTMSPALRRSCGTRSLHRNRDVLAGAAMSLRWSGPSGDVVIPFWSARRRCLEAVEIAHSLAPQATNDEVRKRVSLAPQSLSTSAEARKMALWVPTLCAEVDVDVQQFFASVCRAM